MKFEVLTGMTVSLRFWESVITYLSDVKIERIAEQLTQMESRLRCFSESRDIYNSTERRTIISFGIW